MLLSSVGWQQQSNWGMSVPGGSVRRNELAGYARALSICIAVLSALSASPAMAEGFLNRFQPKSKANVPEGDGSIKRRRQVLASLPMQRLTPAAQQQILSVAKSPTIFRQLPTQAIQSEREMILFIARNPEVLVGLWDIMGVTKVRTQRTGPYQLKASDGSGTTCTVDLIYGDSNLHIYIADGSYDGKMVAKPIRGKGVFVFRTSYAASASGDTTVTGTLDCFVQFDSLGADLIARTLSGFIGRSADHNYIETARFLGQVSQASQTNPSAMIELANRLPQVSPPKRREFVDVITTVARRKAAKPSSNQRVTLPRTAAIRRGQSRQ